jgi:alkanesulfonate monooxygenase SsuD/methylene tetrahydromethanopterin reductase-like flavin-dependent oxidoreductase (luciferase family)
MVPLAQAIEEAGLDGIGVADSPHLHGALYPVVHHILASTSAVTVGPFVTNPVTRHPSVHAADLDALECLFPGRVSFGIGTGDSAVTSVGLRPATAADLARCVETVRVRVGGRVPPLVAVGGLRAAANVPPAAAGLVLGGGLDEAWSARLVGAAERSAGHRLERWGFLVASLGPEDQAEKRRRAVLGSVLTVARHALSRDMRSKNVPEHLAPELHRVFADYDVSQHGALNGPNQDAMLRHPKIAEYLLERFSVTDASTATVRRLRQYADRLGLDGLYLSSTVPDRGAHVAHIGADLLRALESAGTR